MKQIDKLLIKAQNMARGGMELCLAMVLPDGDSWAAEAHLWDGKNGHARHPSNEALGPLWVPLWSTFMSWQRNTQIVRMCRSSLMIWGDPLAEKKRLKMSNPREIRRTLNRISNMMLNGELDAKTGNAIVYACNATLGAIRVDEQQAKLDELEKLMKKIGRNGHK